MTRYQSVKVGKYDSKLERDIHWIYQSLVHHPEITLKYKTEHNYHPDFLTPTGIYLEAKGYFTPQDRTKLLAVINQNPSTDLRLLFSSPNKKLNTKSKTSYADWADSHGILWCPATSVPAEWME